MNSSHFSDNRICIKDVIVSAWGHKQVPTLLSLSYAFCPYYAVWRLKLELSRCMNIYPTKICLLLGKLLSLSLPLKGHRSPSKPVEILLVLLIEGIWYFELTLLVGLGGCHSFGGRCFLCILAFVNSTAWENIFIPLRPIVHNSHQQHIQHAAHEKTRQEEGERGGEHSVGRSTDRDWGGKSERWETATCRGIKCWEKEES